MDIKKIEGYIFAFLAVLIWGISPIFLKKLLISLSPFEIVFFRFFIAYIFLLIIKPNYSTKIEIKQEILFFLLGVIGINFYFYFQTMALKYTLAINIGLIFSTAPLFTSLLASFFYKEEKFSFNLILGFIFSLLGLLFIFLNRLKTLDLSVKGEALAFLCVIIFASYANLIKKVDKKIDKIIVTRRIFFYAILSMAIQRIFFVEKICYLIIFDLKIIIFILFLAIFSSSLAYIFWNQAIKKIGAIKTINFMYLLPLLTVVSAVLFLDEKMTLNIFIGGIFIFIGLIINSNLIKIINWKK